ncbi:MAG: helix-turn-helix domain-containing protein [Thermodesulfobacteriota bacterium]
MLLKQADLRKLIKCGESETVEFKASFDKEILETSAAFANTKGGVILIGISDRDEIKGIQIGKETLRDWANQISQSTEPRIIPEIEIGTIDGKNVVVIWIKEFPIKPVSVKGRCFRRVGNSNRVVQTHEIVEMHLQSTGMSWDRLPVTNALIDEIDLEKVKQYIESARDAGRRKISGGEKPLQILEKLEVIKDGKVTWAAILLFYKHPQRFLSQAVIHCGKFKEETIVVDDRMIEGTVIEQIEEAMDFIRKNVNVRFVMTGKPAREEVWDYPLEALREAVINAICHRDYTIPSNTEVRIYDNELIVWNPGGLPLGLTLEDLYRPHPSVLRNKGIGGIFYDMGLIEQWGSGIDKMRKACVKAGIPEPKFEEHQGFRVVFRKDIYTEEYLQKLGLNERQIKAVMYVKEKGKITNQEFQKLLNVSKRTVTNDLEDLVKRQLFEKVGTRGRGTFYKLKKGQ